MLIMFFHLGLYYTNYGRFNPFRYFALIPVIIFLIDKNVNNPIINKNKKICIPSKQKY